MNKNKIRLFLAVALFFVPFFQFKEVHAESHEITETYVGYYDQYHNGDLQKHYKAKMHKVDGEMAYCISMTKTSEPGTATEVNIKKFLPGDELVMACLAQEYIFSMEGYTTAEKYMLTQCMVWYIQRDHIGDGGWRQYVSDIDMSVNEQKTFYADLEKKVKADAPRYEGHGTAWENIDFEDVQEVGILFAPTLKTGEVALRKTASVPEIVKDNACYSLKGAQYGVYTDEGCTKSAAVLTTDENGNTESVTLEIGKYFVKEVKPSKGYELDKTVYPAVVSAGKKEVVNLKETPAGVPLEIYLDKLDRETKGEPQGAADLAGAEFTICYYDGFYTKNNLPDYETYPSKAKRKWVIKTVKKEQDGKVVYYADMSKECQVEGDEYYRINEQRVLPLGTVSVTETKAPEGYTLEGGYLENSQTKERVEQGAYVTQVTRDKNYAGEFQGGQKFKAFNQVIRGDLKLRKIEGESQKGMAGVSFRLTSVSTGESHVFTTDENGEYHTASSFIRHSYRTNGGEAGDGLWFGITEIGEEIPADDKAGALPYDTYELEEIPGENNKGMEMFRDQIVIRREKTTVHLNNLENHNVPETPEEPEEPTKEEHPQKESQKPVIKKQKAQVTAQHTESVKTGDDNSLIHLMILFILSCTVLFTCGRIARKD